MAAPPAAAPSSIEGRSAPTDGDLYPPTPAGVPADLTAPTSAYRRHAWLAFAGLMLFVGVYVGLTGYLGWIVWSLLSDAFTGGDVVMGVLLSIVPALFLFFLVRGLFVVKHSQDPSLIEVTEQEQPELHAFVNRVADDAGAPRPHRVYLSARVNAAVFYDLSFWNLILPSKKNLELGLGLIEVLTLDELKAVVAHEFGHFAQRTMAVGRWVYVAHQIAGHLIAYRGGVDRFLTGLSYTDIRIAWIGWILRLLLWSIRAVLDTAFRLVLLAHRALTREMELQADLVAVSVSGSDSLVHALHKLNAADDAWDRAARFADAEIGKQQPVADLFVLQGRVLEHLRETLDDEDFGLAPPRPRVGGEAHRVFEEQLAQPPRMWSTHPPSREREDNVKRRYVTSALDERSGWILFRDAAEVRRRVTKRFFDVGGPEPVPDPAVPMEQSLARIDEEFAKPRLNRRYRGAYLGRNSVECAAKVADLYTSDVDVSGRDAILKGIDALYPDSLKDQIEHYFDLRQEKLLLEGLLDGVLDAPGGVIKHRGHEIPKRKLSDVVERVESERAAAEREILAHDRRARTLHGAAARALEPRWADYHNGLVSLLHYSDHVSANIRDARGYLHHAVNIVLADGHVSGKERRWLVTAAGDLWSALEGAYQNRPELHLPPDLEDEAGELWREFLDRSFDLPPPSEMNIGDWLNVIDSWTFLTCVPLERIAGLTLEELLEVEDHLAECLREERDPGSPRPMPMIPGRYTSFVDGAHRERQKRLGWWDRFVTADGFVPGLLRLVVATAVLVPALALGAMARGEATVHVYNGLGVPVVVTIEGESVRVGPRRSAELELPATDGADVRAVVEGGREIEAFEADIEHGRADYAYNVGGAAPLVAWQAVYTAGGGGDGAQRAIGAPRWLQTDADVVFREPPTSVSTSRSSGSVTRDVLTGVGDAPPFGAIEAVPDPEEQARMMYAHVRFDPSSDPNLGGWLQLMADDPRLPALIAERVEASPQDPFWLGVELDLAEGDAERAAVCARHRSLDAPEPVREYAATRCVDDPEVRDARWAELHDRFPTDPWIQVSLGYAHARHGRWDDAAPLLGAARSPRMGAAWPSVAVDIARIRRRGAPQPAMVRLDDLTAASALLRSLLLFEVGAAQTPEGERYVHPWRMLHRGQIADAVAAAPAVDDDNHHALLRMAAASEGASAGVASDAWALPPTAGVGPATVWATMAAAAREGQDWATFAEQARDYESEADVAALERIVREGLGNDDPAVVDDVAGGLAPRMRGHAYVMGIVIFGDRARPEWRREARGLLFGNERPYFASATPTP